MLEMVSLAPTGLMQEDRDSNQLGTIHAIRMADQWEKCQHLLLVQEFVSK